MDLLNMTNRDQICEFFKKISRGNLSLTLSPDLACISDKPVRLLPEKNDHFDPKYAFSMYNVDCRLKLHVEKEVLLI